MTDTLWIALGGAVGAVARYAVASLLWPHRLFPYNILAINLSGSILIAVVMVLAIEYGWLTARGRLFLVVGVLGGYTTFSTFILGSTRLMAHDAVLGATYLGASLGSGLLGCWLGLVATRRLILWVFALATPAEES